MLDTKVRLYYHKGKSGPRCSRSKDGLPPDEDTSDPTPISLYEIQDLARRDPAFDCLDTLENQRDAQAFNYGLEGLDGWYYREHTRGAYYQTGKRDSAQSRDLT